MSQLISCQNANGIVLAADSRAIFFDVSGKMSDIKINRLVQLSQHTAILTGGATEGMEMCQTLKRFVTEEGLNEIQDSWLASMRSLCERNVKLFLSIQYITFTLSSRVIRLKIQTDCFDSISSGPRKNFLNLTAMRSLFHIQLLESWALSTD